ncbi:hypothetical protein Syun_011299 [Stephania yunnanensis]|uniref:ARM repeat superfamily protein n=1 Tax=Stephania yunnanensis TaxID=152371 RepID=A0AAP0JXZ9_9MAGN
MAVEKEELFDQILVPIVESSLSAKDSKKGYQSLILLDWLFRDELIFQALASNLAKIIVRKEDRYISLGWCTLTREIMDAKIAKNEMTDLGIEESHGMLLRILCPLISYISSIMVNGSILQDGFELPTRLSISAADCILALTEALTKQSSDHGVSNAGMKSSDPNAKKLPFNFTAPGSGGKNNKLSSSSQRVLDESEKQLLLWDHLESIIILVQKLLAWSQKSRPLHAKGLEQVFKWLLELKDRHSVVEDEIVNTGSKNLKIRRLLLASCWKHYCKLLRLEDLRFSQNYIEMLNQYISGIQFYTDEFIEEHSGNEDAGTETRKFFLNCMCLLLGRLDSKQLDVAMFEHGAEIPHILLLQLQSIDKDVTEVAASILREIVFGSNDFMAGKSFSNAQKIETVFPALLKLLDGRDITSRAVVMLTAEYCCKYIDGQCFQDVFKHLTSENIVQRRNAIDVTAEIIRISSDSGISLPLSMRQDMVKHLLDRLEDEEQEIRKQASNLFPALDPPLVIPELVHLVYSPNEITRLSASDAFLAVLVHHKNSPDVIIMLLDCLREYCQSPDFPKATGDVEGQKDSNQLLKLIPEWAKTVDSWDIFIGPLIDKMFAEPSNAIVVRFLSCISENLASCSDVVFTCVLSHVQEQEGKDGKLSVSSRIDRISSELDHCLFDHLCPLLIIRVLPLRVFNDLGSSVVYGHVLNQATTRGFEGKGFIARSPISIGDLLLERAFNEHEFEEVRKLAAELCGRIHPKVLLPILCSLLDHHAQARDVSKIKTALFALCTSLVLRGRDLMHLPDLLAMRKIVERILLWPSTDGEVSKVQHGCIDCLALMICSELQSPVSSKESAWNKISIVGKGSSHEDDTGGNSVLNYVIQHLLHGNSVPIGLTQFDCPSHLVDESSEVNDGLGSLVPLSFRLCMANSLISACQKISSSGKKSLAEKILPVLVQSIKTIKDSEIRAACLQVLFSSVYHLKTMVLPYSFDLLKLSVKALERGSDKEKMASAKLMASLMASDSAVVESISGGLLEARLILSTVSGTDPSAELRLICKELLACMTSPLG